MADITILNSFFYPIKIFLYYNLNTDDIQHVEISTFFGNGKIKTFYFSPDSLNLIISIKIKLSNNALKEIYTSKLTVFKEMYYEFLGSINYNILRELNPNEISNYNNSIYNKVITLKTSLDAPIKCNFTIETNIPYAVFEIQDYLINKEETISFSLPINSSKFTFFVFFTTANINLNDKRIIDLTVTNSPKCYKIIRIPYIHIFEYKCSN